MHKTVISILIGVFFTLQAAGQLTIDTLQNKASTTTISKQSNQPRPVFLPSVVPANFYTTHLPFFCDKELKLQKAVKFPVIFRIGSVEACNKLEGKH